MNAKKAKQIRKELGGKLGFGYHQLNNAKKTTFNVVGEKAVNVTKKVQVQLDEEGKKFEEMEIELKEIVPKYGVFILPNNINPFMNIYRKAKSYYTLYKTL